MKQKKNPAAVALARLSKGVPKSYTEEERELRRQRMAAAREKLAKIRAAKKKGKA